MGISVHRSKVEGRSIHGRFFLLVFGWIVFAFPAVAQQSGGIRGIVYDKDFDAPLAGAEVTVAETGQKVTATDEGNYVISGLQSGTYTLVVFKDGYTRKVFADVVVPAGSMTDQNASLSGEFTDMEEFVVQDLDMGGSSEEGLLNLRMEAPALMDSVGADLMSKAGASDAAQALTLVPGTTIQDGKYAVVRGLPDRYVNSQMNGVRLPTADPDKRAVQLDQFPSAMIESVQVSKTFTPDQQGDASGGAVNIILKGIPDERVLKFKVGTKYKTNVGDAGKNFLVDNGVDISTWGHDADNMPPPDVNTWTETGVLGTSRGGSSPMYEWSITVGDKFEVGSDLRVGFVGSVFYKRDASYREDATHDSYWLFRRKLVYDSFLTPKSGVIKSNGKLDVGEDKYTSLFDETKGTEELQWGALGAVGAETENNALTLLYSYNFSAENTALLREDTEGKYFYFPGYDITDPTSPGGAEDAANDDEDNSRLAPFRRVDGLEYIERIASSLQLSGKHTLPIGEKRMGPVFIFEEPEFDWMIAESESSLNSPDRRVLDSIWYVDASGDGQAEISNPSQQEYSLTRKWRKVEEMSSQYFYDLKLPFKAWNGEGGFVKLGVFNDQVDRKYDDSTYMISQSDFNAINSTPIDLGQSLGGLLSSRYITYTKDLDDMSYDGKQKISAWYYMTEFPVFSFLKFTGGKRFEKTDISTSMRDFNPNAVTFYESSSDYQSPVKINLNDANAKIRQNDVLPSIGFEFTPHEKVIVRGSYAETTARMTFKELVPIQQQETVGGDIFIGNPDLQMSSVKNYDLRVDFNPYPGGLISFSWFKKEIEDVIDYRQVLLGGSTLAIAPDNYPKGVINGYEFEIRQSLGTWWRPLEGLDVGANLTMMKSELEASLEYASWGSYMDDIIAAEYDNGTRDMMGTPEYLYNLNATYIIPKFGTELGLFYTVKGDALIAAGAQNKGNYVPSIYEKEYGTLNFSLSQRMGEHWKLGFKAKNLLDPEIQSVYRSRYTGEEVVKTSYKKGMEFSVSLEYEF